MRNGAILRSAAAFLATTLIMVGCSTQATSTPTQIKAPATGQVSMPVPKAASTAAPAASPAGEARPTAATSAPSKASEETTVKYGDLAMVSDAGVYIAMEKGYFKEQGLKVELTTFKTANDMVPALATGQLDAGGGTTGAGLFNAINREIPIRLVADKGSLYAGGFASLSLVVRKDLIEQGKVKDYSDLKGLKIAIPAKGTSTEIFLYKALEKGKLTPKDVEIVILGNPDQPAALANGGIDAGVMPEPFVTQGELKDSLARFKDGYDVYPNQVAAAVLYAPQFIRKGGDLGNRFMIGYIKGLRDYNDAFGPKARNTSEIITVLTKYTNTKDPNIVKKAHPSGLNPDGYIDVKSLAEDLDWYAKNGYVKEKPDINEIVDHQYVDNAIKVLGKYQR